LLFVAEIVDVDILILQLCFYVQYTLKYILQIMRFFDSHCHIQDRRIYPNHKSVLKRAVTAGIEKILCCGTCEQDWEKVAALATDYKMIIPSFGVHPWFVRDLSGNWYEKLENVLIKFPEAAVGEIGLDHLIKERNDIDQLNVFSRQIELAARLRRPVSIHCRKAFGDLLKQIKHRSVVPCGGVVHSYSGSPELVGKLQSLGLYLSFSGSVTYDKNRRARLSAQAVSDDYLLIETDSPDILPSGYQGLNEPANLTAIVNSVSFLRKSNPVHIAEQTYNNSIKLFDFCKD